MSRTLVNPPAEPEIPVKVRGRKLVAIQERDTFKLMQWEMDFRFVRECEFLERDGRVSSRSDLERALGMERGGLSVIRLGGRGISAVHIRILFEKYRGDKDYIMFGGQRNKDLTNPYIPGIGRINGHEMFFHRYNSTARWKVGPRPETHEQYYPADPKNENWVPPTTKSIKDLKE